MVKHPPHRLVKLPTDDRMVYNHIETSGEAGMWSKSLRAKTNLHQTVVNKCLKTLESQALVQEIKSAKFPARKIYMLRYLTPSEETTGGVFFTDGEMDMALIDALGEVILRFVQEQSWGQQSAAANNITDDAPVSAFSTSSKKRSRFEMEIDEKPAGGEVGGTGIFVPPRNPRTNGVLVPKRPQSTYPTTTDIHRAITDSQILNEGLNLTEGNVQQLLDSLVFDGRLERMRLPTRIVNGRPNGGGALRARSPLAKMEIDDVEAFGNAHRGVAGSRMNGVSSTSSSGRHTHGYRTTRPLLYRPPLSSSSLTPSQPDHKPGSKPPIFYLPSYINGLSSAPCCRCPVFQICEPGGPVSAEKCEYFARWLGIEAEWVPGMEDYAAAAALAAQMGGGDDDGDEMGLDRMSKVEATQPFEGVCTVGDGFAVPVSTDGRRRAWYHG